MNRLLFDFLDTLEWNLVSRASYQAMNGVSVVNRLLPRTYLIQNSHVVIVGIDSQSARSTWNTGGWARMIIPFAPSSTTVFVAAVNADRKWLRLRNLNLVVFPKITDSWILEISFPYWFDDVLVEIWRYDGRDVDQFQRFNEIEDLLQ